MYLEFYGLEEKPFTLLPNPKYLYYSNSHKEALAQMIYAVTEDTGFMALIGEVGLGKTMLINSVLQTLPADYSIANIHYTALKPKGLIQAICNELNVSFSHQSMAELIFKLQEFFQEKHKAGKKAVLIIDEAQSLSQESLEVIRLLTNIQSSSEQYLHILLVGQPELDKTLANKDLRQLRERIGLKFRLTHLTKAETRDYIYHRLAVAGNRNGNLIFSDEAIEEIYRISQGVPRRINILCDNALILSYSQDTVPISRSIIATVGQDEPDNESARINAAPPESQSDNTVRMSAPPPPPREVTVQMPTSALISDTTRPHPAATAAGPSLAEIEKLLQRYLRELYREMKVMTQTRSSSALFPDGKQLTYGILILFVTIILGVLTALLIATGMGLIN